MHERNRSAPTTAVARASLALGSLILAASSAAAGPDPEGVLLTLYVVDSSGKAVKAPGVKVHVSRLGFDPVTKSDGTIGFSISPGSYTLSTVSGRFCRFDFKVLPGKQLDLPLIIPATGEACTPATKAALAAPAASASGAALAEQPSK
jgi:hypothetical protein